MYIIMERKKKQIDSTLLLVLSLLGKQAPAIIKMSVIKMKKRNGKGKKN